MLSSVFKWVINRNSGKKIMSWNFLVFHRTNFFTSKSVRGRMPCHYVLYFFTNITISLFLLNYIFSSFFLFLFKETCFFFILENMHIVQCMSTEDFLCVPRKECIHRYVHTSHLVLVYSRLNFGASCVQSLRWWCWQTLPAHIVFISLGAM